jgi:hypothetical protein
MAASMSESPDIDFEGASPVIVEEVTTACAEELEGWAKWHRSVDVAGAQRAGEIARELRVTGWMIGVSAPGSPERRSLADRLELLAGEAATILDDAVSEVRARPQLPSEPPPHSGERPAFKVRITDSFDDDATLVKKPKWDATRSTNRVLKLAKSIR